MTHRAISGSMMAPRRPVTAPTKATRRTKRARRKRYRFQPPIIRVQGRKRRKLAFDKRHPHIAQARAAAQGVRRLGSRIAYAGHAPLQRVAQWGTSTVDIIAEANKRQKARAERERAAWRKRHAEELLGGRPAPTQTAQPKKAPVAKISAPTKQAPAPVSARPDPAAGIRRAAAAQRSLGRRRPAQWTKDNEGRFTGSVSTGRKRVDARR